MKKDVKDFISEIENEVKRKVATDLVKIMEQESGYEATLYGKIIGFGRYHYKYASGREGDALVTGFSPRKKYHHLHNGRVSKICYITGKTR